MKRNQNTTIVTHAEILCYAIANLTEKQNEWEKRAEEIRTKDPQTAKEFLEHSPYKDKIAVMKIMYKLETGEEYCE